MVIFCVDVLFYFGAVPPLRTRSDKKIIDSLGKLSKIFSSIKNKSISNFHIFRW